MSSIIKIKRSTEAGAPTSLADGELAYSAADYSAVAGGGKLYIGINSGLYTIGGKYFTDKLDHGLGVLTPGSAILVDDNSKIDNLLIDNLQLNGNTLSSTNIDGDININPSGNGNTVIKNLAASGISNSSLTDGRVVLASTNGLLVDDENFAYVVDGNAVNVTLNGQLNVDNIRIDGNGLTTTNDNGNLILSTISTNSDTSASQAVVVIGNTRGLVIPVGTEEQRPSSPTVGLIRYNTSNSSYEGYNGSSYVSIGGVKDVDGNTYIIAESSPGANENTLYFYTDNQLSADLDSNTFNINLTTGSTSTTTGALVVDGGMGLAENLYIGGDIVANDALSINMIADSVDAEVLAIDAQNSGDGAAIISIGSGTTDELIAAAVLIDMNATTFQIDANIVNIATTDAGDEVRITTTGTSIKSDTITVIGKNGTGDSAVTVTGSLDVDNIKLDGNTISTTDNSNILYLDPAPVEDNGGTVVIKGNLQVDGTTTTINSTEVTVDDPVFVLGGDTAPESADNLDRGIKFNWHDGNTAQTGFFGYDDSESEFIFIPGATDTNSVFSGTLGNLAFGIARLDGDVESTTTNTGTLKVTGGVGITKQLNVGGDVNTFTGTTQSTSTATGTVVISGGVGIAKTMYIGEDIVGAVDLELAPASNLTNFIIDGGTY